MKVVVVGAGVVGLCIAYFLRREGAEVTVVDRGACGSAASLGNAGWITPSLSAPLASPGVASKSLRWMFQSDSPLLIRPRLEPSFIAWCWRFWRSCGRAPYRSGLEAMLALNEKTLALYDLLADEGVDFEMHDTGLLFIAVHERSLEEESRVLDHLRSAGYVGAVDHLDGLTARRLEPAISEAVVGAHYAREERHVRPETLTAGLADALEDRGVEIVEHTPVAKIERRSGSWQVCMGAETVRADRVVIAAGVWTKALLANIAIRIPLEAAKGYSVTVRLSGESPRHPLYMIERKVGFSPFTDCVRLAGTLELAGLDSTLNDRRLQAIIEAARQYLRDWSPTHTNLEWAGLRPLTPDTLPLIGAAPGAPGMFVATGHGMLGVTLAPATGAFLASLVLDGPSPPELHPFRLDR